MSRKRRQGGITRQRGWLLALLLTLIAPLSALAQPNFTTPEMAAEQVEKPGYYEVRLPGIPYRAYHETRLLYGWEPTRTPRERYATTPEVVYPYRNYESIVWHVTAPEGYRRAMPPGVLVFIVPGGAGRADPAWRETLDELNLICVEISSGTQTVHHYAHAMAVMAIEMLAQRYPLNPRRIYLAGEGTSADVAVVAAALHPEVFRAAWLINGGASLTEVHIQGDTVEGLAPLADRGKLRAAAGSSQFLFMNTERDIERIINLTHAQAYQRAGFRGVTVWDEPDAGGELPGAEWLARAIDQFDKPLHRDAERAMRRAVRDLEGGRTLRALEALFEIAGNAPTTEFGKAAREQIAALLEAYDAQVAAIEAQIAAGETAAAQRAIGDLRRVWDDIADADIDRLETAVRDAERGE